MDGDCCGTCRFFRVTDGQGACHRRAPKPFLVQGGASRVVNAARPEQRIVRLSFWPPVGPHLWCGEHQPGENNAHDLRAAALAAD